MEWRLSPREELSKERRQRVLAKFQYDNNLSVEEMNEYFAKQARELVEHEEVSLEQGSAEVTTADYALHHFLPRGKWKKV